MKFVKSRKGLQEKEIVDAPAEIVAAANDFKTMPEMLLQAGLALQSESPQHEGPDETPIWDLTIEGLSNLEVDSLKFTVFTPGESSSGDVAVDILVAPGLTAKLFTWLKQPAKRKCKLVVKNHEELHLETWEMQAFPVALAVNELNAGMREPWFTTLQLSLSDIKIT